MGKGIPKPRWEPLVGELYRFPESCRVLDGKVIFHNGGAIVWAMFDLWQEEGYQDRKRYMIVPGYRPVWCDLPCDVKLEIPNLGEVNFRQGYGSRHLFRNEFHKVGAAKIGQLDASVMEKLRADLDEADQGYQEFREKCYGESPQPLSEEEWRLKAYLDIRERGA